MIHELIAEKNSSFFKERLKELSKEDKFSVDNFWKMKKKFYKTAPQNKCSIVNDDNLELYIPEQIVSEYRKEFQTILTERKIHPAYKNVEHFVNEIFERCHNESKVKNEEKDFTLEELKPGLHIVVRIAEHACDYAWKRILKLSTYRLQIFLMRNQYLRALLPYRDQAITAQLKKRVLKPMLAILTTYMETRLKASGKNIQKWTIEGSLWKK